MKKTDICLAIFYVLSAFLLAIFLFRKTDSAKLFIYTDGDLKQTINLSEDKNILIDDIYGENEIEIKNKKVKIISATCKDQICVKHRAVSLSNESIICIPNRLIIRISSSQKLDAVLE